MSSTSISTAIKCNYLSIVMQNLYDCNCLPNDTRNACRSAYFTCQCHLTLIWHLSTQPTNAIKPMVKRWPPNDLSKALHQLSSDSLASNLEGRLAPGRSTQEINQNLREMRRHAVFNETITDFESLSLRLCSVECEGNLTCKLIHSKLTFILKFD